MANQILGSIRQLSSLPPDVEALSIPGDRPEDVEWHDAQIRAHDRFDEIIEEHSLDVEEMFDVLAYGEERVLNNR